MSQALNSAFSAVTTESEVRDQLATVFDFHEKSAQAHGDATLNRHNDGQDMYKRLGFAPFHEYLALTERQGKNVATYPSAWVTPLVHLKGREIDLVDVDPGRVAAPADVHEL